MLFIEGALAVIFGITYLLNKEAAWEMSARRYRIMGLSTERTPEWDTRTSWQGGLMIVLGVVLLGVGFRESDGPITDNRSRFVPHLFE